MHTTTPFRAATPVTPTSVPRPETRLTHRGPTAPLRIVVLDGNPTTEVFDVAAAPREIAIDGLRGVAPGGPRSVAAS